MKNMTYTKTLTQQLALLFKQIFILTSLLLITSCGGSSDGESATQEPVTNEEITPADAGEEIETNSDTDCSKLKTFKMLMEKYRVASEAMKQNGDGLDYSRLSGISSTIKMNIQDFDRAGESAFSSNCWEEYQQLKDEFTSSSLTNQIQDNEPQDVDFDNTVD